MIRVACKGTQKTSGGNRRGKKKKVGAQRRHKSHTNCKKNLKTLIVSFDTRQTMRKGGGKGKKKLNDRHMEEGVKQQVSEQRGHRPLARGELSLDSLVSSSRVYVRGERGRRRGTLERGGGKGGYKPHKLRHVWGKAQKKSPWKAVAQGKKKNGMHPYNSTQQRGNRNPSESKKT